MTGLALLAAAALAAGPSPRLLSLDEAVRLAREGRPDLRAARATASAADASADEARAALLPQVAASAAWQREAVAGASGAGQLSAAISAEQLLWDFGRSPAAARAARATARAEQAGADETALTVVQGVRRAYFEARARRTLAGIARAAREAQARQAEKVAALVEVGSRPPADLARARRDLAEAELSEIQESADAVLARARLRRAIGLGPGDAVNAGDDLMPTVPGEDGDPAPLVEAAMSRRPAARQAAERVRAQEETAASARGSFLPALSLIASGTETGAHPADLQRGWTAGLALTWSLFDGGSTGARVRRAEASRASALAQADALRQDVALAVEEAVTAIATAKASAIAAGAAMQAAEEDLRLADARYETGAGTLLEVSDSRAALSKAAAAVVRAAWDLSAARADLVEVVGEE